MQKKTWIKKVKLSSQWQTIKYRANYFLDCLRKNQIMIWEINYLKKKFKHHGAVGGVGAAAVDEDGPAEIQNTNFQSNKY